MLSKVVNLMAHGAAETDFSQATYSKLMKEVDSWIEKFINDENYAVKKAKKLMAI